ncbi:hypothetical protein CcCBS67573_g10197 [Chytriomyces confervae]|uniref:Uncharacterized protein n=1 Tax=Chytriomyces confervae TaxID=246404 RepID=A0A507DAA6_9FUNG|nr:hypothetical protein CcCBS67573_g10197 [Chytriomyces confervae]
MAPLKCPFTGCNNLSERIGNWSNIGSTKDDGSSSWSNERVEGSSNWIGNGCSWGSTKEAARGNTSSGSDEGERSGSDQEGKRSGSDQEGERSGSDQEGERSGSDQEGKRNGSDDEDDNGGSGSDDEDDNGGSGSDDEDDNGGSGSDDEDDNGSGGSDDEDDNGSGGEDGNGSGGEDGNGSGGEDGNGGSGSDGEDDCSLAAEVLNDLESSGQSNIDAYKELVTLTIPLAHDQSSITMHASSSAPATLQTLIRRVFQHVAKFLPLRTMLVDAGTKQHLTPHISITSCISIWLMSPPILLSIKQSNQSFTLPHISITDTEAVLLARIKECETLAGNVGIERAEECTEYYDILLRTISLWLPKYKKNASADISTRRTPIFLRKIIYNDGFGWMGRVKDTQGQWIFAITAADISRGIRSSPTSNGVLPLMLTASLATKTAGGFDMHLSRFSEELESFSKGVEMSFGNESFLVFGFVYAFVGDTPARKTILGLYSSVSQRTPCPVCETPHSDFVASAKNPVRLGNYRNPAFTMQLLRDNAGKCGKIMGANGIAATALGVETVPIAATWPGSIIPLSSPFDIMHESPLGALQKHFNRVVHLVPKNQVKKLYLDLSKLFSDFCKQSRIPAEYSFKDANSMKGLKGYGLKEFFLVSPWLLLQLKVINPDDATLALEFRVWCKRVRIFSILCAHKISPLMFHELKAYIADVLHHYGNNDPEVISLNVHYLHHVENMLMRFGPLRDHWCFVYEHLIGIFKSYYRNTNNIKVSLGVFRRHLVIIYMKLMAQRNGEEASCPQQELFHKSDCAFQLPPRTVLDQNDDILYTHSSRLTILNWQSLKIGDYILLFVGSTFSVAVFQGMTSHVFGQLCTNLMFSYPCCRLEMAKKEQGSLQWLRFTREIEDCIHMVDGSDAFVRRLKVLHDGDSLLVVDDVTELYYS